MGIQREMVENIGTREQLRAFAERYGLRDDWHEPDQRGIDAMPAVGQIFDNAMCDPTLFDVRWARREEMDVFQVLPEEPVAEHGVFLFHDGEPVAFVNLAVLFALAAGAERIG